MLFWQPKSWLSYGWVFISFRLNRTNKIWIEDLRQFLISIHLTLLNRVYLTHKGPIRRTSRSPRSASQTCRVEKGVAITHNVPDFDIMATLCSRRVGLVVIGVWASRTRGSWSPTRSSNMALSAGITCTLTVSFRASVS